jgi:two-component system, cell cycle sensor histidine kinase and response regulator CckA
VSVATTTNPTRLEYPEAVARGILEAVPGGVVHVDAKGAIVNANAEALRVLGLSYDTLTESYTSHFEATTIWEDGSLCPTDAYPVSRALATGEAQPATTIGVRRPDGDVSWAVFRAVPLKDEASGVLTGAIATFLDITERKAREAERDALEVQLRHAQRLDSIGQLAGGIAHEFNNLLQIIMGNTELTVGSESMQSQLHDIRIATERAAELTEGLLAFARRQPLARSELSLEELLRGARRLLKPLIGQGVTLEYASEYAPGSFSADRHLIEQAVVNLCLNARDAMPEGGTIRIATERVVGDAAFVNRHPWAAERPYLVIRVADTGPGIPHEHHTRIFEPFFTTKPAGVGTGLGLSVVYGVMQNHGGAVTLDSTPGQGATFSLFFPEVIASAPAPRDAPVASRPGGKETILVVEDEDCIRRLVVRLLTARGYAVLSAANGREALEIVNQRTQPIDLLFVDVVMPGMRGPEFVRRARERRPGLQALFTTGYELKPAEGEARGRDPVLYKPYTPDQLLPRLREVLDGAA